MGSPKYGGGMSYNSSNAGGSKSVNTSPKLSSNSSPKLASVSPKSGNFVLPNTSASPRYIGGGSVTPPDVSPKHSMTAPSTGGGNYSSANSANQNNKSSPSSRSPHASTQGQNTMGGFKTNSVFSIGNSGKPEASLSGSNSTSKNPPAAVSNSSIAYPNTNRNLIDQSLTNNASGSGNLINQTNQSNEIKKVPLQSSTLPSTTLSIPEASDNTEKSIIPNSAHLPNVGSNSGGKSSMLPFIDDIPGQ